MTEVFGEKNEKKMKVALTKKKTISIEYNWKKEIDSTRKLRK